MEFDHIAINVEKIEKSVKWYVEQLGAVILYKDRTWALLKVGDIKVALTLAKQHKPHIAFKVGSLSGFDKEEVKMHRDGSQYVYKEDPDGNVIEWVRY